MTTIRVNLETATWGSINFEKDVGASGLLSFAGDEENGDDPDVLINGHIVTAQYYDDPKRGNFFAKFYFWIQ
jgi:hypothetical protein